VKLYVRNRKIFRIHKIKVKIKIKIKINTSLIPRSCGVAAVPQGQQSLSTSERLKLNNDRYIKDTEDILLKICNHFNIPKDTSIRYIY